MQPNFDIEMQKIEKVQAHNINPQPPVPDQVADFNGREVSVVNTKENSSGGLTTTGKILVAMCIAGMASSMIIPELAFILAATDCTKHPKIAHGQICFDQNGNSDQITFAALSIIYPAALLGGWLYKKYKS